MHKMIIVKDLYKRYGKLEVLKGLNLEVSEGETVVILGRSGVGKSVLLKHIIGIEKPDSGSIEIDKVPISSTKANHLPAKMGMLFQGLALFDSLTVAQNTAFYLRENERYLPKSEINERVSHALELVGLSGTENKLPSDLSGGMRKRAALARLIVYHPKIILYDEPTTGLDPITAMQINDLINMTQEQLKATSIVVTHDIRSALEIGDRFALHHEGKITQIAPKDKFMKIEDPLIHAFFENALVTNDLLYGQRHRRS